MVLQQPDVTEESVEDVLRRGAQGQATVEDVLWLGSQGERYELVAGELVPMSPTGKVHGDVEMFGGAILHTYVLRNRLGKVVAGEVLFRLAPDLARAPDLAFVRRERWRAQESRSGPFIGPPDLAVEIVSPSDSSSAVQKKVEEWLAHGTIAVLVMYPELRSVVLWRLNGAISLSGADVLDLDPVIQGFQARVVELFPPTIDELDQEMAGETEDRSS